MYHFSKLRPIRSACPKARVFPHVLLATVSRKNAAVGRDICAPALVSMPIVVESGPAGITGLPPAVRIPAGAVVQPCSIDLIMPVGANHGAKKPVVVFWNTVLAPAKAFSR